MTAEIKQEFLPGAAVIYAAKPLAGLDNAHSGARLSRGMSRRQGTQAAADDQPILERGRRPGLGSCGHGANHLCREGSTVDPKC